MAVFHDSADRGAPTVFVSVAVIFLLVCHLGTGRENETAMSTTTVPSGDLQNKIHVLPSYAIYLKYKTKGPYRQRRITGE